ncbi:hypothetical protein FQN54_004863 [Arachnomyces sp. PD_36]|nr:hypothetical protein FQN54_004863 [Arachnomyces sp. PD_36]
MDAQRPLIPPADPAVDYKVQIAMALREAYNDYPNAEDMEGRPISLADEVNTFRDQGCPPHVLQAIQAVATSKEQDANRLMGEYTNKYGYHPLFRAGIRQYFATFLVAEFGNFFRHVRINHAGRRAAQAACRRAQRVCFDAIDKTPWMNRAETSMVLRPLSSHPAEADDFWSWITVNRISYLLMQAMIVRLNQRMDAGEPYDSVMIEFA